MAGTAGDETRDGAASAVAEAEVTALLDAGAVLPVAVLSVEGAAVRDGEASVLTARGYRHAVLGGRPVVRLVQESLGAAEDLSMEFLGFDRDGEPVPVGTVRERAVGFPAWALVHDPANGHHALELVKDIERLSRMARTKAGAAKDGFDALGDRLARSAPHFLPTYYEEAGRCFLAAENTTYAAAMFGKAREAERTYALAVDEERLHAVFLEFALAGALTAKALGGHARELAARVEPRLAFDRYRRLCVERVLGGLPPHAAMAVELRRLGKAAGEDPDAVDEAVLADLIDAPAVLRAPEAFWKGYHRSLVRLARRDATVRRQLLAFFPRNCPMARWLTVLEECGAVDALTALPDRKTDGTSVTDGTSGPPSNAAESDTSSVLVSPPDGAAGWLSGAVQVARNNGGYREPGRCPELQAVAERMAPRLIADAAPLTAWTTGTGTDLDMLDLCLTLGIPVAGPARTDGTGGGAARLSLHRWINDPAGGRDLLTVAADERFRPLLRDAVAAEISRNARIRSRTERLDTEAQNRINALAVTPGLRPVLHDWLADLARQTGTSGLARLDECLDQLQAVATPAALAVNPDAVRDITGRDVAALLGRTLRTGVFDELGWPALDEVFADQLHGGGPAPTGDEPFSFVQWPYLVVVRGDICRVLGPDGLVLEHHWRVPPEGRRWQWMVGVRESTGQLLVTWYSSGERRSYWSGTPDDVFSLSLDRIRLDDTVISVPLPGGGRTFGGRPLVPGDRAEQYRGSVLSDGTTWWVLLHGDDPVRRDGPVWVEFDPATGATGRTGIPSFFEDHAPPGTTLLRTACRLLPAPHAAAGPLGGAHGLLGWRVHTTADGTQLGEGIDGRRFTWRPAVDPQTRHLPGATHTAWLAGALRLPGTGDGAAGLLGVVEERQWGNRHRIVLVDADGFDVATVVEAHGVTGFTDGTPHVAPSALWDNLRPRDPVGSAALRAVTDAQAVRLLAAAAAPDATPATVRAAVQAELPAITHPALVAGVAGVVRRAAAVAARLVATAALVERATTATTAPAEPDSTGSEAFEPLDGLLVRSYGSAAGVAAGFSWLGEVLNDPGTAADGPVKLPAFDWDWPHLLGVLPAALWRAASPLLPGAQRESLLTVLEAAAASGLVAAGARLRVVRARATPGATVKAGQLFAAGSCRALVTGVEATGGHRIPARGGVSVSGAEALLVEFSPDGTSVSLPGLTVSEVMSSLTVACDAGTVLAFCDRVRKDGPVRSRPELVGPLSDAAGWTRAEAAVLLAGVPTEEAWAAVPPESGAVDSAALFGPEETTAALRAAVRYWSSRPWRERADAVGALLPADPLRLWDDGPDIAAAADWARRHTGRTATLPDDVVLAANRALGSRAAVSDVLHGLVAPTTCPWLATDDPRQWATGASALLAAPAMLSWLVYHLAGTDPLRAELPTAAERLRAAFTAPGRGFHVGSIADRELDNLATALGVTATPTQDGTDIGPFRLTGSPWLAIHVVPERLRGADDPAIAVLRAVCERTNYAHLYGSGVFEALRLVLDGHLDTLVAAGGVPLPETGFAQHPGLSVPDLVAEVATATGLGADAAVLYLQLLALADPTDRNVARWTGWKPARLKKARAELAATDLVVEAKRSRAGRSLFLPGGWLALGTPHTPLERWKAASFGITADGQPTRTPVLPAVPVADLFRQAWQRVRDGDAPAFEELTTRRRR